MTPAAPPALGDLSRLCVHTMTTKPLSLEQAAEAYAGAGVKGITVWREALAGRSATRSGDLLRSHGLAVVASCRGGFFAHADETGRRTALDDNRIAIDEAAALGAPLLVLVCGAVPGQALERSREQIRAGIEAIIPHAERQGVRLAIEPLHPMYADSRSAINTLRQANDLAQAIGSESVGVAVDVYHVWWDPDLEHEIMRAGSMGKLLAFHVCDWKSPTEDLLLDRGLPGEGCIDVRRIRSWVDAAGFRGFHEVEIFSRRHWASDQQLYLSRIVQAYLAHV
jgi:sugar phosphate isomerase/epimerase